MIHEAKKAKEWAPEFVTVEPVVRPKVRLPGIGRPKGEFASQVGTAIGPLNVIFKHDDRLVEVRHEEFSNDLDAFKLARGGFRFTDMDPARFSTWVEQYVNTGCDVPEFDQTGKKIPGRTVFKSASMSESVAGVVTVSPQFLRHIPRVTRILDVAIPIRKKNGEVIMPKPGYNPGLCVYCAPNSPPIIPMTVEDALDVIRDTLAGFSWKNGQSITHAVARLLTPYGRGLMGFSEKTPLWFFSANRPRAGKDYLAGITQIVYLGNAFEDAALGDKPEETCKRITAALSAGRRQIHFANCQGYIDDRYFIQAITNRGWNDRRLGSNGSESDLNLANEAEFSISANVGVTYREDVEPRSRKIELAYFEEDENARVFPNPNLHDWLIENRSLVLSAIDACFQHWIKAGMPPGPTPFNSYPKWAEVIGGVMAVIGLDDPCKPHEDQDQIGGDQRTVAMRALYELAYDQHPGEWLKKSEVFQLIQDGQKDDERLGWFGEFDGDQKDRGQKRAGRAISAFQNRVLSKIQMTLDTSSKLTQRHLVRFADEPGTQKSP